MDSWGVLLDLLILLGAALALGTIAEQLRQNVIVGYLLAGTLVGPNVLGWVGSRSEVDVIAELGVALLLFTIGLEFSFRQLVRLGPITFVGGTAQVVITTLLGALTATACGFGPHASLVIGAAVALSSTACVVRVLFANAQTDSPFGRNAVGILLLQDMAVVPLVLLVSALGGKTTPSQTIWILTRTVILGGLVFAALYILLNYLIPSLLHLHSWTRNRELPILLATIMAVGSAFAAHKAGLSPAFGAFLSGLLLAESPFAVQIRADIGPLRTLLVTLFFAAIGILVDPFWVAGHWGRVAGGVILVILGKSLIIWFIVRFFHSSSGLALATGLCLAQVGEFSFVLAQIASAGGLLGEETFQLIVSITVVTLLLTPYLVRAAPILARWVETVRSAQPVAVHTGSSQEPQTQEYQPGRERGCILIVGFGPAGQRVANSLLEGHRDRLVVIDLNPRNARTAKSYGIESHIGDASHTEVLQHLQIQHARAVVITIPDTATSKQIIHLCKFMAPNALIVARARYHIHQWQLREAGAEAIIDEEEQVGLRLAEKVHRAISENNK